MVSAAAQALDDSDLDSGGSDVWIKLLNACRVFPLRPRPAAANEMARTR